MIYLLFKPTIMLSYDLPMLNVIYLHMLPPEIAGFGQIIIQLNVQRRGVRDHASTLCLIMINLVFIQCLFCSCCFFLSLHFASQLSLSISSFSSFPFNYLALSFLLAFSFPLTSLFFSLLALFFLTLLTLPLLCCWFCFFWGGFVA